MPAGQRPAGGQRGSLRIGGPFRIDFEDRASLGRQAFAQRRPEVGPVLEVTVEDRPARSIVQVEPTGKAPAQNGGGRDRPAGLDPEVAGGGGAGPPTLGVPAPRIAVGGGGGRAEPHA